MDCHNNFSAAQIMNNHGASLFAAGDTESAIGQFSDALHLVREVMHQCCVTPNGQVCVGRHVYRQVSNRSSLESVRRTVLGEWVR